MKIGMSEQTARKLLDRIGETADQDLMQVQQRLEQGLKATTAAGFLTQDDLTALIDAAQFTLSMAGEQRGVAHLQQQLVNAIPKLEALKARRQAEG